MTLLTVEQTAAELGISRQAVHQLLNSGTLTVSGRAKYRVVLIDGEQVEAEKDRRVERATAALQKLGYAVVLEPSKV